MSELVYADLESFANPASPEFLAASEFVRARGRADPEHAWEELAKELADACVCARRALQEATTAEDSYQANEIYALALKLFVTAYKRWQKGEDSAAGS